MKLSQAQDWVGEKKIPVLFPILSSPHHKKNGRTEKVRVFYLFMVIWNILVLGDYFKLVSRYLILNYWTVSYLWVTSVLWLCPTHDALNLDYSKTGSFKTTKNCMFFYIGEGEGKESWDFIPPVVQMRIPKMLDAELTLVNSPALEIICSLHE